MGVTVRSPIVVKELDTDLCRMVEIRVPRLRVRKRSGYEPRFKEHCRGAFKHRLATLYRSKNLMAMLPGDY